MPASSSIIQIGCRIRVVIHWELGHTIFHPPTGGLHQFSSINRRTMMLPSNLWTGRLCLVTSSRSFGYLKYLQCSCALAMSGNQLFIHWHEGYTVTLEPLNSRLCLLTSSRLSVTQCLFFWQNFAIFRQRNWEFYFFSSVNSTNLTFFLLNFAKFSI
jgi:hypothetical protein